MRRAIAGAVASVVLATACSPFDEGTDTTARDGGGTPDSGAAAPGPDCARPTVTFKSDFAAGLGEATKEEVGGEASVTTTTDADGIPILRAMGRPPRTSKAGLLAFADWSWPAAGARSVRLAYDYRTAYTAGRFYGELGCRIGLEMEDGKESALNLVFDFTNGTEIRLGGRHPVADLEQQGTEAFTPTPSFSVTPLDKSLHRATIQLDLDLGTSNVTGMIDGLGPAAKADFRTPTALKDVTLWCGIVYAENSDEGMLTAEIANVTLLACP